MIGIIDGTLNCRVCLISGEDSVGNTSIISRYIEDNFYFNTTFTSAPIMSYKFEEINYNEYNINLKFDIWDTTGKKRYREVSRNFYLSAGIEVFILVYDVTRKDTFTALKDNLIQDILFNVIEDRKNVSKINKIIYIF